MAIEALTWRVEVLGQNEKRPKVQPRDEQDALPFDDPLTF
jgi:hypothetical protein